MDENRVKTIIKAEIAEHEKRMHGKGKRTKYPTIEDIKQYQKENPELNNIDAEDFWKGYAHADPPWTDTQGKPVKNWKLKLRTRSNCQRESRAVVKKQCRIYGCRYEGPATNVDDAGQAYYICPRHNFVK